MIQNCSSNGWKERNELELGELGVHPTPELERRFGLEDKGEQGSQHQVGGPRKQGSGECGSTGDTGGHRRGYLS